MARFKTSIRNKVRLGFYFCIGVIIIVSLINYLDLKNLTNRIRFKLIISELYEQALEIRRQEKNYFLYGAEEDYEENRRLTLSALETIELNREEIKTLSPKSDITHMEDDLREYYSLMGKYREVRIGGGRGLPALEGRIREKGKEFLHFAGDVTYSERKEILSQISTSRRLLMLSVAFLAVAGFLIAHYLSIMVARPLKRLENTMRAISQGRFETLSIDYSSDMEMVQLSEAFNRMLGELEARRKRLMHQSEKLISLGTMASGVAHELNNPLSNISTSCQILQEELDSSDAEYKRELLRQIESEVDRAKSTVRGLLEFSRKKDFGRTRVKVNELIIDTLKLMKGDMPTGVEVKVSVEEGCMVYADRQRVQQALLNLVKNAVDAIPGEGEVNIAAYDEGDGHTKITVRDDGAGVEPENQERIFDPFFTTKGDGKGSGLGLFVTREIIEEHGGAIDVESAPGGGTTFLIRLPSKEEHGA